MTNTSKKATILQVGTVDLESKTLKNWIMSGGTVHEILPDGTYLFGGYTIDELIEMMKLAVRYGSVNPKDWPI